MQLFRYGRRRRLNELSSVAGSQRVFPGLFEENHGWTLYRKPEVQPANLQEPAADQSERERMLLVALAKAKQQLVELRRRVVLVDVVAAAWATAPINPTEAACGLLIRSILEVDEDTSLKNALAELERRKSHVE